VGPAPTVVDLPAGELTVPDLPASMEEAYRLRPDLRQDEETVRIAESGLELARIRRRPILSATAGINVTPTERNSRGDWSIFTGISMPIWDAHVSRSRVAEASASLGGASARLEQTRKDVEADVQQAVLNLASARERVDASQASVEAATVALQAANARFEVGLAISIEITDAQVNYIQARNTQITALYDYYVARAQLDRAIGRYRGGTRG
jgi:outer membrane protein